MMDDLPKTNSPLPSPDDLRRDQTVSFRCIPPGLKKNILQFAARIGFPAGIAARLLLEFGIQEYRAGKLVFKPQPSWKGWTLYPEAGNPVGRPNPSLSRRGEKTILVTFRGIPDGVMEELYRIREENYEVPLGEVARRFFEHGLAMSKKGLVRAPEPVEWLTGANTRLTLIQRESKSD